MSDKARKLIKQAIQSHLDDDGASDIGAYRDVVTEVLHFAHKKFKTGPYSGMDMLRHWICSGGFDGFEEELEEAELRKLNKIPDKKLPLHTREEFECESVQKAFEFRLKGEPQWQKLA
jgi:hypothetical protein